MTDLARYVLAVHDGDLDAPFKGAVRLTREARDLGLIACKSHDSQGRAYKYPVRITKAGIAYLRDLELVRPGESAG